MAKKILIFSLAYYPKNVSGAEIAIREITDRISSSDITFHLITHRFYPEHLSIEQIGNVTVYRVGSSAEAWLSRKFPLLLVLTKILFTVRAAWCARTLHKTEHYDALWAMMTYMLLPIVIARSWGMRIPYALTLQDGDPYEKVFGRLHMRPFITLIDRGFREATIVQVISHFLGTWPAQRGYTGAVELIYNGADPGDVDQTSTAEEIANLAEKLGKKQGDIFLVNTARVEYQKAFDVVVRALAILPVHFKLLIVGSGSEDANIRALASSLGVSDRMIFIAQVTREEVTLYRRVSDIFVAPSRSEGLGNAFLSAMASRLPVVATQEGGLAEFVFDRAHNPNEIPTAWVVPKDDPKAVADAVLDIISHPDEVATITNHAREMVLARFDWKMIVEDMRTKVFARLF